MFNEAGVNGARRELAADNLIENAAETVFTRMFWFVGKAAHNISRAGCFGLAIWGILSTVRFNSYDDARQPQIFPFRPPDLPGNDVFHGSRGSRRH